MRYPAAILLAAALAGCDAPTVQPLPAEPATGLATLECTVSVTAKSFTCAGPAPSAGGASADLITGGQGRYVFLQGSNVDFVPGSGSWSADITVQNLMPQALGTIDGDLLHANGVRVFFVREPVVTAPLPPAGTITIQNRTGLGTFTAAGQPYFQYDEILSTNETSAPIRWRFSVPAAATKFEFSVAVSAEVQYPNGFVDVTGADTLMSGATATLAAAVRDARGDPVAGAGVSWSTSDAAVATVSASGGITAVAPGTATITATSGARSGSTTIAVCPQLEVGGVYVAAMPAGASLCLGGQAPGAEYTVVPVNTSAAASVALGVTGAGIVGVSGLPTPDRLPGLQRTVLAATVPDDAFETRLRQMERRELAGRGIVSGARRSMSRASAIAPGVPAVGDLMSLNVRTSSSCSSPDFRTGRVMAVGARAIMMADTMNPSGGFTSADYQAIADTFDARIHPVVTGAFGTPADIDGNGRVVIFYTRAVNELTPPGASSFVGGFVFARDLFSTASCPGSNQGEMFYMLAPDPAGAVNGNVRSTAFVLSGTFGTLGHEYQHLINASRRMYVNTPWNRTFEEGWLDEGLSHMAEELLFYSRAGIAPGANLDAGMFDGGTRQSAYFAYAAANVSRLRQWLLQPEANGPFHANDNLSTRGAAWAFLRYAADRSGTGDGAFFGGLVNTQAVGLANLQAAIGTDPLPWFRDFAAAIYADDAAGTPAAAYRQPSWNFRSIFSALDFDPGPACACSYPLAARNPANGVTESFTLAAGGAAAYLRMGVSPNAFAGVTVRSGGAVPSSIVQMAVTRRK